VRRARQAEEGSPLNEKATTVFGEVVSIGGEEIQVRLDTDDLAILHDGGEESPHVGYRGEFTVEGHSPDGRTVVSPARPAANTEGATAFDLEFDRLHSALAGRRAGQRSRDPSPTTASMQEEHIRGWIDRAGIALSQLRKHRAKRLSEQVNDES
jgi:hypothetical protein